VEFIGTPSNHNHSVTVHLHLRIFFTFCIFFVFTIVANITLPSHHLPAASWPPASPYILPLAFSVFCLLVFLSLFSSSSLLKNFCSFSSSRSLVSFVPRHTTQQRASRSVTFPISVNLRTPFNFFRVVPSSWNIIIRCFCD